MVAVSHLLQLYSDEEFLVDQAARYVADGLESGEGAVVASTKGRENRISARLTTLGFDVEARRAEGQLVVLDADDLLGEILPSGSLSHRAFEAIVFGALARARMAARVPRVRVFGEIMDLLWRRNAHDTADQLERLWNDLIARERVSLLCAYRADPLDPELPGSALASLVNPHDWVRSGEDAMRRSAALEQAIEEVLGAGRMGMVRQVASSRYSRTRTEPPVEWIVAWLRENMPRHAPDVLRRAREYAATRDGP